MSKDTTPPVIDAETWARLDRLAQTTPGAVYGWGVYVMRADFLALIAAARELFMVTAERDAANKIAIEWRDKLAAMMARNSEVSR